MVTAREWTIRLSPCGLDLWLTLSAFSGGKGEGRPVADSVIVDTRDHRIVLEEFPLAHVEQPTRQPSYRLAPQFGMASQIRNCSVADSQHSA
jgi:hypothetical protein